jgi:methionine-rich copper-binding protein CopC
MTRAAHGGQGPAQSRSRRRRPRFLALLAIVGLVALAAAAASVIAPTTVAVVVPADGATLSAPPAEVSVTIVNDHPIAEYHVAVSDANGRPVTSGVPHVRGAWITVPVSIGENGPYLIAYHIRFADGAQISGICRFEIAGSAEALGASTKDAATLDRAGHHHGGTDPFSLVLVLVNVIGVIVAVGLLLRPSR